MNDFNLKAGRWLIISKFLVPDQRKNKCLKNSLSALTYQTTKKVLFNSSVEFLSSKQYRKFPYYFDKKINSDTSEFLHTQIDPLPPTWDGLPMRLSTMAIMLKKQMHIMQRKYEENS